MGQKVNPHGLRVGIIKDWESKWYKEKGHERLDSHGTKVKTKGRRHNLYSTRVSRFTTDIMRKARKKLILPRNRLLA